jgi:hypothetical protein
MLTNTKGGASMASRSLRLLLLAIVIELFAVAFAVSSFADMYFGVYSQRVLVTAPPGTGQIVTLGLGVLGLVLALFGFFARD